MSDIVERLRSVRVCEDFDLLDEAAAEIERLRNACTSYEIQANRDALEIERLRAYEHIEGQHGETGRIWAGPRYKMPAGFFEVSNESGDPGPRAALAPGDVE
jgi:hypothetical protein